MKAILILWLTFGLVLAANAQTPTPTDDEVAAREAALTLAGAFSNEGFKIRDGNWAGKVDPETSPVIQVNLYAGNQYWFSVGATGSATKIQVKIYDETGQPVAAESYQEDATGAAGFEPETSGPYYVKVAGEGPSATFCMIYSYK